MSVLIVKEEMMAAKTSAPGPSRNFKIAFALCLAVALLGSSAFLATSGLTGIVRAPGIFGTKATLFADINLVAQIVLLLGLGVGMILARRGNITAHQYNQTAWVLFNIVLTIFVMFIGYVEYIAPGLPGNLREALGLISTIHAALGLLAIFCGVYLILQMNRWIPKKWRIKWWRRLMRLTLALYWLVGILGLGIYYVWYMR
jgi:uncharacterized membrane protein YozB (DUF420 family)